MDIKEMREMTGQTQKKFADSFDIPLGTLRRWEYGESRPAPYVLKMIEQRLPMKKDFLKKIESPRGTYYYDQAGGMIIDSRGTRIPVAEDLAGVHEQNLVLYANTLFEAYYDAVDKFNRDCRLDKTEDILWG